MSVTKAMSSVYLKGLTLSLLQVGWLQWEKELTWSSPVFKIIALLHNITSKNVEVS